MVNSYLSRSYRSPATVLTIQVVGLLNTVLLAACVWEAQGQVLPTQNMRCQGLAGENGSSLLNMLRPRRSRYDSPSLLHGGGGVDLVYYSVQLL